VPTVNCPQCRTSLSVNGLAAGAGVRCPSCQKEFRVPGQPPLPLRHDPVANVVPDDPEEDTPSVSICRSLIFLVWLLCLAVVFARLLITHWLAAEPDSPMPFLHTAAFVSIAYVVARCITGIIKTFDE